jgi:DNA-binding response OmpR family regulator
MRVLVADHSATLRDGAAQALQAAGHDVVLAADGLEAWEAARKFGCDAAFVAWDLPGLDGLELASLWQQDEAEVDLQVIMLVPTAQVPQARAWAKLTNGQAPAWDVLTKPFAPGLMVDVLEASAA